MPLIKGKIFDLIKFMYNNKRVTKKDYPIIGFHIYVWSLRDMGLAVEKGTDNRKKIWVLTDKGKEVAKMLIDLEKVVGSD
jgi:hypothetical protein